MDQRVFVYVINSVPGKTETSSWKHPKPPLYHPLTIQNHFKLPTFYPDKNHNIPKPAYRKVPKFSDTIFAVSYLKFKQSGQTLSYFVKMVQWGIANTEDPDKTALKDQTARLGAAWSGSALFAQTYLSENLGLLR